MLEQNKVPDEADLNESVEESESSIDPKMLSQRIQPPPNLENLLYNLEAANSHPSSALIHLKQLAKDVDIVLDKLEIVEANFGGSMDNNFIEESIETFMQNAQLLIDNHFELQNIMLTVLSKLSIIKFHDFGLACFNTLKDLMKSGRDMEN